MRYLLILLFGLAVIILLDWLISPSRGAAPPTLNACGNPACQCGCKDGETCLCAGPDADPVPLAFMAVGGALATAFPEAPGDVDLSDLNRFPPGGVALERRDWLMGHWKWAVGQAELRAWNAAGWDYAREVDAMWWAWHYLWMAGEVRVVYNPQGEVAWENTEERLRYLKQLRDRIGHDAYARGEMPFPRP